MISQARMPIRKIALAAALVLAVPALAACDGEGSAERAGEKIDQTISETKEWTGNTLENLGQAIQDKSQEAREALRESAENTGDAVEDKAEDAGDALQRPE